MYLFLDNSQEGELSFVIVYNEKKIRIFVWRGKKAERGPLFCFDELLQKKAVSFEKIRGLGVRVGVGRFTATRVATVFANTLGYFLKKPVVGLSVFDPGEFLAKIKNSKPGVYVSAKYSAEANIGKVKETVI